MKPFLCVRSAALVLLLCLPAAEAEVIISEIMYNADGTDVQTGTDPFNREWVEIYNNGSSVVDLSGWTFQDIQDGDSTTPLAPGMRLFPGEAMVLTGDLETFESGWGMGINAVELGNFPSLANAATSTNETLAIVDAQGSIRDAVNYENAGTWPHSGSQGSSIVLAPGALDSAANNLGTNWLPAMDGVYGGYFTNAGGQGENRGSPGYVDTQAQSPFTPSPDAAWSMVVFGDIQNYAKSSQYKPILTQMTQWVRDNRDTWNIQVLLTEGDLVNNNDTEEPTSGDQTGDQQWQNLKDAFTVLDGQVPYILATGNHDHGTTSAQDRTTQLNSYFHATDNPLNDPAQGGILQGTRNPGQLENAYYEFTAPDGREMLIFSLEWGPRQQSVDWADYIAGQPEYADHTAVLTTHAYMYHDETRYDWARNLDGDPTNDQGGNPYTYPTAYDTNDGEDLWQELVGVNENFEMVFSGHVGGDGLAYQESTGTAGNTVHEMLFNTQFVSKGGEGWFRVVEFLEDGETVRVRTFTPHYDLEKFDGANNFEFKISALWEDSADFDDDGDVDVADLLTWQSGCGLTGQTDKSRGDADRDGDVDADDLAVWREQFASGASAVSTTVPEPAAGLLALVAFSLYAARRRAPHSAR